MFIETSLYQFKLREYHVAEKEARLSTDIF